MLQSWLLSFLQHFFHKFLYNLSHIKHLLSNILHQLIKTSIFVKFHFPRIDYQHEISLFKTNGIKKLTTKNIFLISENVKNISVNRHLVCWFGYICLSSIFAIKKFFLSKYFWLNRWSWSSSVICKKKLNKTDRNLRS